MDNVVIKTTGGHINGILANPSDASCLVIIAHGAGAPMTHVFISTLASGLSENQMAVLRFNFPYIDAGRKSPGSPKPNIGAWHEVVSYCVDNYDLPLIVSGKSYGGRMASHMLSENPELDVRGIIYFGFPLHAPGRDSTDRATHMSVISQPQLFIQGTRDTLANYELMKEVISNQSYGQLVTIDGADHSFRVSGRKSTDVMAQIVDETARWVKTLL